MSGVRLAGRLGQELAPLLLVEGDAVAYRSVPAAHFGGCGDEEAAAGEDPLFNVVEVAVTQALQPLAAWGCGCDRWGDDVPDEARTGGVDRRELQLLFGPEQDVDTAFRHSGRCGEPRDRYTVEALERRERRRVLEHPGS